MHGKQENSETIRQIWREHGGSARGAVVCGALAGALAVSATGAAMIRAVDPDGTVLKKKTGRPIKNARAMHGPVMGTMVGAGIQVGIGLLLIPLVAWVFVFPRRAYPWKA